MKNTHILQQLVLPTPELAVPEGLYWQSKANTVYHARGRFLELLPGGRVNFLSFFNAFPVNQWNLHHNQDKLYFLIKGQGAVVLEIYSGAYQNDALLVSELIELNEEAGSTLPLPAIMGDPHAAPKLLYVVVSSLSGARITEASYVTSTTPRHKVRVGLSITHFKREAWVLPAVERIRRELLDDPAVGPSLHLFIVDNSQSLSLEPHARITVVPNRNLGGAGGFARGLLECDLADDFTHCLFLDDDATMELESVRRAVRAVQYAPADTAITGTLFYGDRRSLVHEAGANYKLFPQPVMMGLDMRLPENIDRFIQEYTAPDYGGWWFFLFPLAHVRDYPFPSFVRGDDIAFGLTNKFRIRALLGVACWAEDFASKDGPFLRYLDLRSIARMPMIADTCKPKQLLRGLRRCIFDLLLTYRYASAEAALLGIRHALEGEAFWRDNVDLKDIREAHQKIFSGEAFCSLEQLEATTGRRWTGIPSPRGKFKQGPWRIFLRLISLNGHLVPKSILAKKPAVLAKGLCAPPYLVYPHSEILYVRPQDGQVMLAQRDVWRALSLAAKTFVLTLSIKFRYARWKKSVRDTYFSLTRKDFWKALYDPSSGTTEATTRTTS